MPKLVLVINTDNLPEIGVTRDVKTLKDTRRFFRDADATIGRVLRVLPRAADTKVLRVHVK